MLSYFGPFIYTFVKLCQTNSNSYIKVESEVVCTLSNGDIAGDLG